VEDDAFFYSHPRPPSRGIGKYETQTVFDMPIPENEIYLIDTVVRLNRTNEFGIIKKYTFQHEQKGFLNYLVQVEDKDGLYFWFHYDIDLECLP
jgi:hypothetical protein